MSNTDSMPTYLEQTGAEVQEILNRPEIKRNSQLINDEGYINREEDPTVPSWSKQPNKPTYTAEEVGAMPSDAAFKTINGESVKGSGNINTEALELAGAPFDWALGISADDFLEYFGHSATKLLARGIAHYDETNSEYLDHYFLVSGQYPDEQDSSGTIVFDDGNSAYQFTITRLYDDEDATDWDKIENLKVYPSHLQPQANLNSGSATEVPSVKAVKDRVDPIDAKIPAEASSSNKLADKAYVDGKVAVVDEKVGDIEDIIPDQASASNKLADKNYVHSEVQQFAADYRGIYVNLRQIPTDTRYYPSDEEGNKIPNRNDFLVVDDVEVSVYQWVSGHSYAVGDIVYDYDEWPCMFICKSAVSGNTHPEQDEDHWELWFYCDLSVDGSIIEGSWLFTYTGSWETKGILGWLPRYQINEAPFTVDQWEAINSGMNTTKRQKLDALPSSSELNAALAAKQDKLIDELNIKSVNGQAIMGSGTLPLLNQSLNEIEITNVEPGVIYQAFVGGPSLICAEIGLDQSVSFSVFNPSDYPCELDLYASEDDPEASVIITMEPFEWMEISGSNVEGSIDWDVVYRSSTTKEVFVATVGVTTLADVDAALNSGKLVLAEDSSHKVYAYATTTSSAHLFTAIYSTYSYRIAISRQTGSWGTQQAAGLQATSDRLTAAPTSADLQSTTKYPSMKVAADYIDEKLGDIETLLAAI